MNETPTELSEKLLEQSAEYQKLSDELIAILETKAQIWMEIRAHTQSDTSAERAWGATPNGVKETSLRLKLKSLEKGMGAIKTRLRVIEMEVRNLV